jgi:predicted RNA-binding Zn ribbon-like protein
MSELTTEASGSDESAEAPRFRLDNERLAFRFTATLSDRGALSVERLPAPGRLGDWLAANDLTLADTAATGADLDLGRRLREAIHRAGTATAAGDAPDEHDARLMNALARDSEAYLELDATTARWRTRSKHPARAALGIIALDAISVIGGPESTLVKTCENPSCRGLYVDTSHGQNRRWCSMNFCGNRAKKARLRRQSG